MKTLIAGAIGSILTIGVFLATGMAAPQSSIGLTQAQLDVLNTMSIMRVPNGQGGHVQTLLVKGVNVQIVNGTGVSLSTNGLGNLILGYNEYQGGDQDNRTGSHNIISGTRNNFTKACGINIGFENELNGDMASLISTENSGVSGRISNITGGYLNTVIGQGSAITSGTLCTNWGDNSHICGGDQNNIYQGTFAGVVGGGRLRAISGPFNWTAGSLFESQ